jgi:hypothetical protein
MLYCQLLARRLRPLLFLEPVPPTYPMLARRIWYGIDLLPLFVNSSPFCQRSSTLPVANSPDQVGESPGVVGNRSQDVIFPTSPPSSQQFSHSEPNGSDKLKKALGVTWSGLQTALRLLERSADAFPPLKSAVGGLVACLDLAQVGCGCGFNTLTLSNSHRRQLEGTMKNTKSLQLSSQIWRTR